MLKHTIFAAAFLGATITVSPVVAQTSDVIAGQLARSTVSWSGQTFSTENLRQAYKNRGHAPIWVTNGLLNQQGEALLGELSGSYRDGLDPNEYLAGVRGFSGQLSDEDAAKLDLALSDAFLKLGLDLYSGFTTPSVSDPNIVIKRKKRDATQWLEGVTATGVTAMLATLRPRHPQYAQLRQMLAGYRSLMARGGWQPITEGPTLKPGMTDSRVNEMRENLAARGYDVRGVEFPDLYDQGLVDAVKHFQTRHGLDSDGVAGPASFRALSVTAAERVDQIAINLERWRWLPRDLGKAHVLVNQAGFEMFTMNGTEIYDKRRVIVGKPFHQSPMFSSKIAYAEFNPTWTVPLSIAGKEMLPKIRSNPAYLVEKNYSLYSGWGANSQKLNPYAVDWSAVSAKRFPYRIVQEPGPGNALGQVKFIFPNKFSVYLHDTPSRNLFSRTGRAFSHGCIRVDKPLDFARKLYALQGGMDPSRVTPIIDSKQRKRVNFKRKMPVHLAYFTAWINEDGIPLFYDDLYKRDKLVRKFLF
ncbi:MAG: L,D-transpeptidase family protein [Pseudomonadota bacterium]